MRVCSPSRALQMHNTRNSSEREPVAVHRKNFTFDSFQVFLVEVGEKHEMCCFRWAGY